MNRGGYDASFDVEFAEEATENLKKILSTSKISNELTIGIDYGNGKSIQATGSLVNINFEYKRVKRGKKYKLFKIVNSPYLIMQFIGKKMEVCNVNKDKSKFEVGDKVKIKLDKVLDEYKEYIGIYKIISKRKDCYGEWIYKLDGVPAYGTDEYLEKVE